MECLEVVMLHRLCESEGLVSSVNGVADVVERDSGERYIVDGGG